MTHLTPILRAALAAALVAAVAIVAQPTPALATASAPSAATAPASPAAPPPATGESAEEERKVIPRPGREVPWYEKETLPAPDVVSRAPFRTGEHVLFRLRVLGKEAGWGEARVGRRTTKAGKRVLPLEVLIRSKGLFDKVFPVHDEAKAWLGLDDFTPVQAEMTLRENRKEREVALWFGGRHAGRVKGHQVKGKAREGVDDRAPLRAFDPLSAFYHLRTRTLEEGSTFPLFVHNGIRMYRVDVRVAGKEKVYTDLGLLPSWKLVTRIQRADGSRPKWHQDMTFWLSDDRLRLPLKLSFAMSIGTVDATLAGVKGVKGREDLAPREELAPKAAAVEARVAPPAQDAKAAKAEKAEKAGKAGKAEKAEEGAEAEPARAAAEAAPVRGAAP